MEKKTFDLSLQDIKTAQEVLSQYLVPTPVQYNAWLSDKLGCDVFFKLEMMQPIGSFKIRGATYKVASLTEKEKKQGVIAASAGNHAQGVAWGARKSGVDATIVMPVDAPILKVKNTESLGAKVILEGKYFDESNQIAQKIAKKEKLTYVPPFDDPHVMAGQGTIALEVLDQIPDVDTVIAPIGGGGLLGGMSLALKELKPSIEVIGCQASGVNPVFRSFHNQSPGEFSDAPTFADGIAVREPSLTAIDLIKKYVDDVFSCEDADIAASILEILEKTKLITEGAGAISLTALEKNKERFLGKKVCLISCGGNIDVNLISRIIDSGLIRMGRRLRLNVLISDKTGTLNKLTSLIAEYGGNVLQAIHDRNQPGVRLDQTSVALTIETRGREQSQKLVDEITKRVEFVEVFDV